MTKKAHYGWVITTDNLADDPGDRKVSIIGPRDIHSTVEAALLAGKGEVFALYDGDGGLNYRGRWFEDAAESFPEIAVEVRKWDSYGNPLDDYGEPNAGSVTMTVKGKPYI